MRVAQTISHSVSPTASCVEKPLPVYPERIKELLESKQEIVVVCVCVCEGGLGSVNLCIWMGVSDGVSVCGDVKGMYVCECVRGGLTHLISTVHRAGRCTIQYS